MRYCNYCGFQNHDGAAFCGNCGRPIGINQSRKDANDANQRNRGKASQNGKSWVESLNDYVGNDRPADLNWKVLFTDVFNLKSATIIQYTIKGRFMSR